LPNEALLATVVAVASPDGAAGGTSLLHAASKATMQSKYRDRNIDVCFMRTLLSSMTFDESGIVALERQ
jgi:predicted dienelactone hydrolase